MITPTPQSPFLQVRLKHYNTFPAGAEKATKSTRLGIKPRARGCAGLLRNFFATTHTISATGVTTMSKGRGRFPPQGAPGGVSKQALTPPGIVGFLTRMRLSDWPRETPRFALFLAIPPPPGNIATPISTRTRAIMDVRCQIKYDIGDDHETVHQ